jgi:hypothetical protein
MADITNENNETPVKTDDVVNEKTYANTFADCVQTTPVSVPTPANDDIDSDCDENTDTQLSQLLEPMSFTENSGLYVVTIDGIPKFYVKDKATASEKMWEVTRRLSAIRFFSGYQTNFLKIKENEIHILGSYRFFLIAYDTILHRVSYYKAEECV